MRGKDPRFIDDDTAGGITPACAGKRRVVPDCNAVRWDHPRVCREKFQHISGIFQLEGSPPHMRGKERLLGSAPNPFGITPAYAGKRTIPQRPTPTWRDHPRVCGEKPGGRLRELVYPGSPPRVRGKAKRHARLLLPAGITPACAGKRGWLRPAGQRWRDHPRVCGEKTLMRLVLFAVLGSPPRMRGKEGQEQVSGRAVGITPACAGKSARRQAGPPGPASPPQMRLGWSPPPYTGRQCRTRKSTHARRARIPVPAHTPAPQ